MTNREMFLLATTILFASTTVGLALQGALRPHHGPRAGFEHHMKRDHDRPRFDKFARADADKDGFVTREEMLTGQQKRLEEFFATVDTDQDGRLTREEMDKGRKLMREKMKARFEAEREGRAAPDAAPVAEAAPAAPAAQ